VVVVMEVRSVDVVVVRDVTDSELITVAPSMGTDVLISVVCVVVVLVIVSILVALAVTLSV
jgi:hypothetical protein